MFGWVVGHNIALPGSNHIRGDYLYRAFENRNIVKFTMKLNKL